MGRFTPRRPSPALAVASIALFVSLGGVSYGLATGSIDSREIKDNAIRGKDIRNRTLTNKDLGRRELDGTNIKIERVGGDAVKEQVLESEKIGKVSEAGNAETAGSAETASTANSANTASNAIKLGGQGPGAFVGKGELLWGLVDAEAFGASVVRGRGVTGASPIPAPGGGVYNGQFTVTFAHDITACGIQATRAYATGPSDTASRGPDGEISLEQPSGNSVEVNTFNSSGALESPADNEGFYIQVTC